MKRFEVTRTRMLDETFEVYAETHEEASKKCAAGEGRLLDRDWVGGTAYSAVDTTHLPTPEEK